MSKMYQKLRGKAPQSYTECMDNKKKVKKYFSEHHCDMKIKNFGINKDWCLNIFYKAKRKWHLSVQTPYKRAPSTIFL